MIKGLLSRQARWDLYMAGNARFLQADASLAWLGQFDGADQSAAIQLLQSMALISRDGFAERIQSLLLRRLEDGGTPVGLYAERELPKRGGKPHLLFKENSSSPKRAFGIGPAPVKAVIPWVPSVGSEGIVAQLISEMCALYPGRFYDHPGPNLIRKHKIRRFIVVTDFIGSGKRVATYLQAAWRVRSVRSWWSARAATGMSFEVVAYSATDFGRTVVEKHRSDPKIFIVVPCPTISSLPYEKREQLKTLCKKYSPVKDKSLDHLGYGGVGALIAFAHGAPNNCPLILHEMTGKWMPLFQKRKTNATRSTFLQNEMDADSIRSRLLEMRQEKLAAASWLETVKPQSRALLTVMAALTHPPRDEEALARKTGLTITDVRSAILKAMRLDWVTDGWRLTETGRAELVHARKPEAPKIALGEDPEVLYYPKALRVPSGVSS